MARLHNNSCIPGAAAQPDRISSNCNRKGAKRKSRTLLPPPCTTGAIIVSVGGVRWRSSTCTINSTNATILPLVLVFGCNVQDHHDNEVGGLVEGGDEHLQVVAVLGVRIRRRCTTISCALLRCWLKSSMAAPSYSWPWRDPLSPPAGMVPPVMSPGRTRAALSQTGARTPRHSSYIRPAPGPRCGPRRGG